MHKIMDISIRGTPVQWARARTDGSGSGVSFYTAPEQKRYKALIKDSVMLEYASAKARREHDGKPLPLGTPVIFDCREFLPVPPSFNREEEHAARSGAMRPTGKPDLDNWIKLPMDACEGILYANDSQVVGFGGTGKWYSDKPRLELRVYRATADDLAEEARRHRARVEAVLAASLDAAFQGSTEALAPLLEKLAALGVIGRPS
jgi:Holliday junction resolvase RusA-like endonuclease